MCLHTKQLKPSIATKDIECYKVLDIDKTNSNNIFYHSYIYNSFKWKLNKIYETTMNKETNFLTLNSIVTEGFHSYKEYEIAVGVAKYSLNTDVIVAKFIIPKGAEYYTGTEGFKTQIGYTSNKIKMVKVMDYKKTFYDIPDDYPYKVGQKIYASELNYVSEIKNILSPVQGLYVLLTNGPRIETDENGYSKYYHLNVINS